VTDSQLTHLAVLTKLNSMMRSGHFSICTIDDAIKALNTVADSRAYKILRTLHCVEWGEMPPELRASVPGLIERCLNVPAYQFNATAISASDQQAVLLATAKLLTRELQ
jgi:hypothetical protein